MPPLTGGCLCGAVRFEVRGPILRAGICHCSRCRRHSGSGHLAQARVRRTDFRLLAGADKVKAYREPGYMTKAFCVDCGSSLFGGDWPEGDQVSIRMGAFDGDPGVRIQYRTYFADQAPWDPVDDDIPRYDQALPKT